MNTKTKNYTMKLFALILVIAVAFSFASCGDKTLEKYVNDHKETKQEIESVGKGTGLSVKIEGNVVKYTYKYDTTYKKDQMDLLKKSLEKAMEGSKESFGNVIKQLEEETKIEGISIVVEYLNSDDSKIFSYEFNK